MIAKETNSYAGDFMADPNKVKRKIHEKWFPKLTVTPYFGQFMPYRRFILLSTFFHIVSKEQQEHDERDKFKKIRWVYELFNHKFASIYYPEQKIDLDESLMAFRGWLSYIQYNKAKRARFGMKFYKLCESKSGYCSKFKIYIGAEANADKEFKVSEAIVFEMIERQVGLGHTLTLDNWYSSPNLYHSFADKSFNVLGTVNIKRINMPCEFFKKRRRRDQIQP
nr:PREDICTED: piggyBac transposable element-derived protein 4-like [Bemisia tabaci]